MADPIKDVLKKFEEKHEVYVDAEDTKKYWVVTARIPKPKEKGIHNLHNGIRYVTAMNGDGNVLVMNGPELTGKFFMETWKKPQSFYEFVDMALKRILEEKESGDQGSAEGCGPSCG